VLRGGGAPGCVGAFEAFDAGGLGEDLRCGERPAAADREQRRSELGDKLVDLTLELVDLDGECAAAGDELACDPRHGSLEPRESLGEPIEVAEMIQRPQARFVAWVEFVQMPAETADHAGSLAHQVFAVIDEQSHFSLWPVEPGDRQVGFAQRCAGDRERVDRVALAERSRAVGVFAISFGGTLTIRSPAVSRSRSRRRERCRQSSTAQRRSGKRADHATSSRWSADVVATVLVASCRPCSSMITTVWLRLCASIPIVTMPSVSLTRWGDNAGPAGGHIPVGAKPRSSQATAAGPASSNEPQNGQKPRRHITL
jgi:hypothetical protein